MTFSPDSPALRLRVARLLCRAAGAGGLLVSQFLTFYATPIIYLYPDRLSRWSWRRSVLAPGAAPTTP